MKEILEISEKINICILEFKEKINKINNIIEIIRNLKIKFEKKTERLENNSHIKIDNKKNIIIDVANTNYLKIIEETIKNLNLDISIINEENKIKIINPEIIGERKNKIIKLIKLEAENTKIKIRNIRKKLIDQIKRNKEIKKNDIIYKEIQKIIEKSSNIIEDIKNNKIKNL